MKAIIRDFRFDPKNPKIVATITKSPQDKLAIVETDNSNLRRSLTYEGIYGQKGKNYKPEDGDLFIQQMPFHFKSPYLRAEVVPD